MMELAGALERLIRGQAAQDNIKTVIPYARQRLALDSRYEPAYRQLFETQFADPNPASRALDNGFGPIGHLKLIKNKRNLVAYGFGA